MRERAMGETLFGAPRSRVDGPAKVQGTALYAGEFPAEGLAYGWVVGSGIARGRITRIDDAAALAVPGVMRVFTHAKRPRETWFESTYHDDVAPPGEPFLPLRDETIAFSGQPVALVVAQTLEAARYAASLVEIDYEAEGQNSDLAVEQAQSYDPPKKRSGIPPAPDPRGDEGAAFAARKFGQVQEYYLAREYHNPMEPHATTVVSEGDGALTVHDKIQGVKATQKYLIKVFGLAKDKVRVISPFVGGAFGSGLRPQYQLFLAAMAAIELKCSVRVVLTRSQMYSMTFRPETIETVALGADAEGHLQSVRHQAIAATSRYEDYQEAVVNWSGALYKCENVDLTYRLAKLDTSTPGDMRAPGAPTGLFALESAMDELAAASGIDPVELRLRNYTDQDANEGKPLTSKALREAYRAGAERFGWSRRSPQPRSMREGHELIGWGMASGVWEAMMMKHSASATLDAQGRLVIGCSTADIGTGTYTILAQIAGDAMGVAMEDIQVQLADSDLPDAPVEGGSWTAASAGAAVDAACRTLRGKLFAAARGLADSPLANIDDERLIFADGRISARGDAGRSVTLAEALDGKSLSALETAERDKAIDKKYAAYTHSAVFVEVRVDEELGVVRVVRVVNAVAAGRIINPKTARSQVMGGVVFGIGMALHEEALIDTQIGRVMNHNFAEYHIPVNADISGIEIIFVDEQDDKVSPLGVKGVGEIGVVGTAAAIANAVYHATGKRIRSLPITIDALLAA
jgi:xanthine dehydrogenase YagR molybdenum-binding subunit